MRALIALGLLGLIGYLVVTGLSVLMAAPAWAIVILMVLIKSNTKES